MPPETSTIELLQEYSRLAAEQIKAIDAGDFEALDAILTEKGACLDALADREGGPETYALATEALTRDECAAAALETCRQEVAEHLSEARTRRTAQRAFLDGGNRVPVGEPPPRFLYKQL